MQNDTLKIYFDEAWRGPLAGPLFIWLICPIKKLSKKELEIFRDSKQLSEKVRKEHYEIIKKLEEQWKIITATSWMTAAEIDNYGITNSLHCAILRWMLQIIQKTYPSEFNINREILPDPVSTKIKAIMKYNEIVSIFSKIEEKWIHIELKLDWNRDFWLKKSFPSWNIKTIVDWDAKIKEISMASILAKVWRDYIMETLPKKYEKYKFDVHKWYWTLEHRKLIEKFWVSDIHRKLFLKQYFPKHTFQKKLPENF